jgi:hypothetical protein
MSKQSKPKQSKKAIAAAEAAIPEIIPPPVLHQILADEFRACQNSEKVGIIRKRSSYIAAALEAMDSDTEARFEFFIRSHFQRNNIKKILQLEADYGHRDIQEQAIAQGVNLQAVQTAMIRGTLDYESQRDYTQPVITDEMAIISAGLAKLFVGELVDIARECMRERVNFNDRTSSCSEITSKSKKGTAEATATTAKNSQGVDYGSYQLLPCDIREAASRMQDQGKLGRLSNRSSSSSSGSSGHLFGDVTGSTSSSGQGVTSMSTLLHDITHPEGTGASTAAMGIVAEGDELYDVYADLDGRGGSATHTAMLSLLMSSLEENDTNVPTDDSIGSNINTSKAATREQSIDDPQMDTTNDTNTHSATDNDNDDNDTDTLRIFTQEDETLLMQEVQQHHIDALWAVRAHDQYLYNKWLASEEEKRKVEEAAAKAAADLAARQLAIKQQQEQQQALIKQQQQKIASQIATQQANQTAEQARVTSANIAAQAAVATEQAKAAVVAAGLAAHANLKNAASSAGSASKTSPAPAPAPAAESSASGRPGRGKRKRSLG